MAQVVHDEDSTALRCVAGGGEKDSPLEGLDGDGAAFVAKFLDEVEAILEPEPKLFLKLLAVYARMGGGN